MTVEVEPPVETGPWERARGSVIALIVVSAIIGFGVVLNEHYPIDKWLFWKYAKAIGWVAFWMLSCWTLGLAITQRLTPNLPLRERVIQSAACGVYAFYVLQFLGGLLRLFGPTWAVAVPSTMLVVGTVGSRNQLRRLWRHRRMLPKPVLGISSAWHAPVAVFGIACLAGIYLSILAPKNAAFDSVWYHLGLGQGWAADGAILRSPEGWFVEALPNMAAVLYSWGFLLPGLDLFETLMVAAHIEFVLFIVTLAGIPVLARWLLPGTKVGIAWVALFLFPSVFIYDAGLHSGNDHIAAFWAVPIFLALRRAWPRLDVRNMVLLALCAAGAVLTKYQAASLLIAPALYVVGRAVYLGMTGRRKSEWLFGTGVAVIAGLLLTSPLWAKNWIWYGDPFFPALHKHLTLRPWNGDMAAVVEENWSRLVRRPDGTLFERVLKTLRAGWVFSFRSYTAGRFHGAWPYFGSLFTLSVLWLPFVRGAKRTWAVFIAAQLGVFFWFNFSHVERYLQALIPWMAAVVVAALVLAWRSGVVARIPITALVLLQVIWGGDALFIRSHAMISELPMVHSARLIESGFKGRWEQREQIFGSLQRIGAQLPEDSTVLLHGVNPRSGLGARVVTDMGGFQSLIRYGLLGSPDEIYDLYRSLGITHVVWPVSRTQGYETLAGELRFFDFALNELDRKGRSGSLEWGALKPEPPTSASPEVVLYAGCRPGVEPGLYHVGDFNVSDKQLRTTKPFKSLPTDATELNALMKQVGYVVYGPKCKKIKRKPPIRGFSRASNRYGEELWVKRR